MMLSWMTFTLVVGALLVVATLALDHIAVARRWPTRFVWAGAIIATLTWPLVSALRMLRVVDADGKPDMSSFKVVKSSDPQFTDAVKQTLATWKFYPAQVDGRAVRQLLTLPFVFSLQR